MAIKVQLMILLIKTSINWEMFPNISTPPAPRYHASDAVNEEKGYFLIGLGKDMKRN